MHAHSSLYGNDMWSNLRTISNCINFGIKCWFLNEYSQNVWDYSKIAKKSNSVCNALYCIIETHTHAHTHKPLPDGTMPSRWKTTLLSIAILSLFLKKKINTNHSPQVNKMVNLGYWCAIMREALLIISFYICECFLPGSGHLGLFLVCTVIRGGSETCSTCPWIHMQGSC